MTISDICNHLRYLQKMPRELPDEIWRNVIGFEGLYSVSSHGRVQNDHSSRIMKQHLHRKGGYLYVRLTKDGIETAFKVHRLVVAAFLPNPENKTWVAHLNGRPTENYLFNLRYL